MFRTNRRTRNLRNREFSIEDLFVHWPVQPGAYYDINTPYTPEDPPAYQSTAGQTAADDVGDPVGILLPGNRDGRGIVNRVPNSVMAGASGSTPPTGWSVASSATGISRGYTRSVTADGWWYVDVAVTGTAGSTGTLQITPYGTTDIPALTGQSWATGFNVELVSGSLPGAASFVWIERDSGGSQVATGSSATNIDGTDLQDQLISDTRTLSGGSSVRYVTARIDIAIPNTTVVNFVLRISRPRLNQGSSLATYQETGPYLGGPGEIFGQDTSANRMLTGLYPRGGLLAGSATWAGFFTGDTGNYFSTPDSAALDITGDIEIIVHATATDWTPGSSQALASKYTASGNQRSWTAYTNPSGTIGITVSADGTSGTFTAFSSTAALVVDDGNDIWVKIALDVDTGASNSACTFSYSSDGENWTQLGSVVNGGAAVSIFSGTSPLELGGQSLGQTALFNGKIYRAIVKNGIDGTVVADFNPLDYGGSGNTWVSNGAGGETWTRNGSAFLGSDDLVRTSAYQYEIPGVPSLPTLYGDGVSDFLSLGRQHLTPVQDGRGVVNLCNFNQTIVSNARDWRTNVGLNVTGYTSYTTDIDDPTGEGNYLATKITMDGTGILAARKQNMSLAAATYNTSIYIYVPSGQGISNWRIDFDYQDANAVQCDTSTTFGSWVRVNKDATLTATRTWIDINFYADGATPANGIIFYAYALQHSSGSGVQDLQNNTYTLGGSLGTAGLFCEPTQKWSVGGTFATFGSVIALLSKAGATSGNRTLLVYIDASGYMNVNARGTGTAQTSHKVNDGLLHAWLLVWNGTSLTLYLDGQAGLSITVGSAVEESLNILWSASNSATPALWFPGHNTPDILAGFALSPSQAQQEMARMRNYWGIAA